MPFIMTVAKSFFDEAPALLGMSWDEEDVMAFLGLLRESPSGLLLMAHEAGEIAGILGASVVPSTYDHAELVATEHFWYVLPEWRGGTAGLRLFRAFEKWSEEKGARHIIMAHLGNEKLHNAYCARGYKPAETFYMKRL